MADNAPLVLLIEDELPIRRFLRAALGAEGYRVNEADSGQAGLRRAAQEPPDLVILDLGLPDVDGQEVLRQLREWLHAPILVLSARDQEVLELHLWEGLEPRETADVLGLTTAVVRPRLSRARARLRELLGNDPEPPGHSSSNTPELTRKEWR